MAGWLLLHSISYSSTVGKRRLHPAFLMGLVVVMGSQVGRVLISGTPAWQQFARWLTS